MPAPTRNSVFISYSHKDLAWLRLLSTHLKPLTRNQKVEIWSDQKIRKGARWREQIHKQLAMARVGIFLVSADFLASEFIHAEELPPLLKAAEKEGATLLTIIVRPCAGAFQDSPLSQLQGMNGPQSPLSGMSKTQREQIMASVYDELRDIFRGPARQLAATPRAKSVVTTKTAVAKPQAAPKTPKKVVTAPASPAAGAATATAIAKRKAIAANKAKVAAKPSTAKVRAAKSPTAAKPASPKKLAGKPTTRTRKKS